jgi:tetratricopeptide (TPR) repeat protein
MGWGITMPAMKAVKIIAALLVVFFLSVPRAALAQGLSEASDLNKRAIELYNVGRYSDAEPLYKRALAVREQALGPDHPDVAVSLNNLAELYRAQGHYADAEPLHKRALAIREKALGPDHPGVAVSLNNLALLYQAQGRYADAERLHRRALTIREKALGPNHPDVAQSLNNVAFLYQAQGRYADAEPLYKRALAIWEKALGPDSPNVAVSLYNLAKLYDEQARYADAESLYKRALAIREKALGPDHPDVAASLNNLADVYRAQGRYADAEPLFKRSLAIKENAFGPNHLNVALALSNLAVLYERQGRYADAEPLQKRALTIREKVLGPDHPEVADSLNNLAELYRVQSRSADAEPLHQRALAIWEKARGPDHPRVALSLNNLALLYQAQGRYADAERLHRRALTIREKALGPNHLDVAQSRNNLAVLYQFQGRYADAEPLYKQSLDIWENALGPDHPDIALSLNNLAELYQAQGRYADAEPLYKQSLDIKENALGPEHPDVAFSQNNLADLYRAQGRYSDAIPIMLKIISQNRANKSLAFAVLYGSQSHNLISATKAFDASFNALQQSMSSAAGEAVSKLAARFAAGTNELAQLVRKDQDLTVEADRLDKIIIAALSKLPAERSTSAEDQIRKHIEEIKVERDKLQDVFNQRFPDYVALSKPQPLSIQETQALLADDEALIAVDLDKKSYVWVITKDRAEWKELSVSAEDVSKEVEALRAGLNPDSPKPFDRNLAYQLYRQVLGPIEGIIFQKTRLSFVFDGALTSLPPHVLITSDPASSDLRSTDWLARKYAITVLPSTASLKILREETPTSASAEPMIGFGNPVFDRRLQQTASKPKVASLDRSLPAFYRGVIVDTKSLAEALPPLPETADELLAVGKELGAKTSDIKLGETATVTNVKHTPLDNFRVVYFATHALVAGEVEKFAKVKAEPALVLSIPENPSEEDDGLLRASDVAMLKMNADFVVLSACNTAAGDKPGAEALSGLAKAFFYAGAKSLVVSHWEVDSESTVALMTGLFDATRAYAHLSHAEALRMSMLKMIENPSKAVWAQPKYWAPFVVVGEPQKN